MRECSSLNSHKIVILSESASQNDRVNSVWGAESKDDDFVGILKKSIHAGLKNPLPRTESPGLARIIL